MKKLLVKHLTIKANHIRKEKELPLYLLYALSVAAFATVLMLFNYFVLG